MAYINSLRNYNTSLYFTLEFSPGGVANHVTRMISTFTPYSCNDIDEIALDTVHVLPVSVCRNTIAINPQVNLTGIHYFKYKCMCKHKKHTLSQ